MSTVLSPTRPQTGAWPLIYVAVALTTMATLVLELSLTRIFSVVFYYHFAFLAISVALFGLGAGGVLSYFVVRAGERPFRRLGILSAVNAVVVALALVAVLARPPQSGFWDLLLVYLAAAAPFTLAGIVVAVAISETADRVDRVYFFDLLGAAGGCLLLIPFLDVSGGPSTVLIAGVLYASAAAVWFGLARSARGRAVGAALALALAALVVYNARFHLVDITVAKGQRLRNEIFARWNSFSRVAVARDGGGLMIVIDADASTGISQFDLDKLTPRDRGLLRNQGPGFPYLLRPGAKTLVIGAGGGWDLARAIAGGSKDVTGVEINPIIARTIMRGEFERPSLGIYRRPEVRIAVEDGRSFVRRSKEQYQVLQATLVDTWASTAAGAFALSENNLYTTEAFVDYLSHLTPDGVLAFTRWGFPQPRESLRLVSLAIDALERLGERDAWRHVIVIREGTAEMLRGFGALDTVLISRKPFSAADLATARAGIAEAGYDTLYLPGAPRGNPFDQLLTATSREAFYAAYPYDVRPVSDDRPFFFYTVQGRDVWRWLRGAEEGSADHKINLALPTLFGLLGVSLAATLVTLLLPPLLLGSRLPAEPGLRTYLVYFLCLGAGYILVQVGLIQKLVLFLGHPTYALTVVIFSMLVFSGLGSFFSRRIVAGRDDRLMQVLLAVAGTIALIVLGGGEAIPAGVGLPLPVKVGLTVLLIAPAAFLMGIPFPSGIARLEVWHRPSVRWAWSLNAAASVLGSAGAIFLAIYGGLRATVLAGALTYLVALLAVRLTASRAPAR